MKMHKSIDEAVKHYKSDVEESMKEISVLLRAIDDMPKPKYPERYSLWGRVSHIVTELRAALAEKNEEIAALQKRIAELEKEDETDFQGRS